MQAKPIQIGLGAVLCLALLCGCQTAKPVHKAKMGSEDQSEALAQFGVGLLNDMNNDSAAALSNYLAAARSDPDNEDLHFRVTMGLLREHRFTEARALMEDFSKRHPQSAKATLWLALVYRASDLNQKALDTYARACRLDRSSPVPYIEMANILVKLERFPEAESILKLGIRDVKDPTDLVKFRSDLLIRRAATGAADDAERRELPVLADALRSSIRDHAEDLSLLHRLGDLLIIQGKVADAVSVFEKIEVENPDDLRTKQKLALSFLALGDKDKAIGALEAVAQRTPGNARVQYYLGEIYEQNGDRTNALRRYRLAAAGEPVEAAAFIKQSAMTLADDPAQSVAVLAEGRRQLPKEPRLVEMSGYVNLGRDEYEAAIADFEQAEKMYAGQNIEPMTPSLPLQHAIALQRAGRSKESANILDKAMEDNSAFLEAYVGFVLRSDSTNAISQGADVLRELVRLHPADPQSLVYLGVVQTYAKDFPASLDSFHRAAKLAEKSTNATEVLTAQFYFSLGAAEERNGNVKEAEAAFRKCLSLDPEHSEAYNYIAYMWAEKSVKLDEALKLSAKSLELEPDNAAFIDTLGWIYFMKGDYEKAQKELIRAANLLPEDPTIVEHMGELMDKTAKPDKALTYWKRAFVLDPDNEKLAARLGKLGVDLAPLRAESELRGKDSKRVRRIGDMEPPEDEPAGLSIPDLFPE